MLVPFLIGAAFYRAAHKKNLMPWLWAIIGFMSWFAGQIFAGIVVAFVDPSLLYGDDMKLFVPGLIGSVTTSVLAYVIFEMVAKNKNKTKETANENLLDDRYLENL